MRILLTLLLLVAPLAAQHITASNQSDKATLNPLVAWEEAVAIIKQAEGLHDSLSSGEYSFDISAAACDSIRRQQRSGLPPALPSPLVTLGSNTAACEVLLTEEYVKEALHGWQWDWPASTGANHTVCASGCDFGNLETAIAAAACGDTVTVTAGETFALAGNEITVAKPCTEFAPLWIRTSAHASFTQYVRAQIADAALMPKFTINLADAVFDFNDELNAILSVDAGTDTLTMTNPHGLSVGDEVYFTAGSTQPLNETRRFWVLTVPSSTTLTVSKFERADAPTLDLIGSAAGSITKPTSWVRFTGFRIAPTPGTSHNTSALVADVVNNNYLPEARPHHIWFDHMLTFEPNPGIDYRRAINLAGSYYAVTDSHLDGYPDDQDSQALWAGGNGLGPFWIENNYLSATGENIMLGGTAGNNLHVNPGDYGCMITKGNWLRKDPSWKQSARAGSPRIPCVPGEIQTDTDGPTHYVCDVGGASWSLTDDLNIRGWSSKNIFELKKSTCSANIGNLYELSWTDGGQDGQSLNLKQAQTSQNGPNTQMKDAVFYGEIHKRLATGFQIANTGQDSTKEAGNIAIWHSIWYQIDPFLYDPSADANPPNFDQRVQVTGLQSGGFSFRHLSVIPADTTEDRLHNFWITNATAPIPISDPATIYDSIFGLTSVDGDGLGSGTGCTQLGFVTNNLAISSVWVWTFGAGHDLTACSDNYYPETDLDDVGFAAWENGDEPDDFRLTGAGATRDYRAGGAQDASDGKDMGADIDIVKDLTGGAEAGLLSWSEQFGVAIKQVDSTSGTIEWDRPNAANACNLTLYTDYARTVEHGDTNTVGEKADTRTGSAVIAGHATFNLGTNVPLTTKTWYWFEIDCPADEVLMVGSLFTN